MKVAKAIYHPQYSCYVDHITIGKKDVSIPTIIKMWNEVPDEIRKQIQDKYESDY